MPSAMMSKSLKISSALALVSMVLCLTTFMFGLRRFQHHLRRNRPWPADVVGAVDDLPLQVAGVDDVEVDQADGADAGCGEVESQRGAEAAGADAEHLGCLELLLAFHADFGQDQVARVAGDLVVAQRRQWPSRVLQLMWPYSIPLSA